MEKKTSGRRRLEMKAIEDESRRHVAFSKRKAGIFNKAAELSVLTGAEVVVIVFSKFGKAYTFSSPGGHSVLSSLFTGAENIPLPESDCAAAARSKLRRLEDSARLLVDQRKREVAGEFWWERGSVEADEMEGFLEALTELRRRVGERAAAMGGPFLALLNGGGDVEAVNGVILGSPSSEVYN